MPQPLNRKQRERAQRLYYEHQQRKLQQQSAEQERIRQQQLAEQRRIYEQQLAEQQRIRQQQLEQQERIRQQELAEQERIRQQQFADQRRASLTQQINQLNSQKQYIITQELNPLTTQHSKLENQINTEEKAIQGMLLERNDTTKKIVIFIGKTGHGKSAVINRLNGDTSMLANNGPCRTSIGGQSCTQSLQKICSDNLCMIDCPGWADTGGADRLHSNNLCAFLKGCGGINSIVLVRNATEYRFDNDFQQKLKHLADVFGNKFWDNLIIVLTHVDKGIGEYQFTQFKKADEMRKQVVELCNKDIAFTVIPFGLDNYKDKLELIENNIASVRFNCDSIKSPIARLKQDVQRICNRKQQVQRRIDDINNNITNRQNQLRNV